MGPDSKQPSTPPTQTVNRRDAITSSLAGVVVGVIADQLVAQPNRRKSTSGAKRLPKPPQGRRNPRFVKEKGKSAQVSTRLQPGFYVNTRSKVIHYVTKQRTIRQVQRINTNRLKPLAISDVTKLLLNDSKPRVHLSTASRALEEAALDHFKSNQPETAFELLATAIRHDQILKQQSFERPSLRLYDLFAAKAAQLGDKQKLEELLQLARQADRQTSRPPALKVGRVRTIKGNKPPSELRQWQSRRKATLKTAAIKTRKSSFTARLGRWSDSVAGSTAWERGWQNQRRTWEL